MPTIRRKSDFFDSEEGIRVRQALIDMESDNDFNTEAGYSANTEVYANNRIPFVDKHMKYLSENQAVDLNQYLSNLRLMTRIK